MLQNKIVFKYLESFQNNRYTKENIKQVKENQASRPDHPWMWLCKTFSNVFYKNMLFTWPIKLKEKKKIKLTLLDLHFNKRKAELSGITSFMTLCYLSATVLSGFKVSRVRFLTWGWCIQTYRS